MAATEHFDAVIVGSGFGGSVMASELAAAGLRVCVLERGKRYPPGSFPRAPYAMARNFWDPSQGKYGMFAVWSFQHSGAVIGSALGGGSMIYANVLIRKPEAWFQERMPDGSWQPWPVGRADLEEHYDAVEKILGATRYPADVAPYDRTPKMLGLKAAAAKLNLTWYRPNLAVTFAIAGKPPIPGEPIDEPPNLHDRRRFTCRLCGECDIGCNYGSKNTLDYNYLTLAQRSGADLRDLAEVRSFRPRSGGGYEIDYVRHDPVRWEGRPRDTRAMPIQTLTSRRLILAAGTACVSPSIHCRSSISVTSGVLWLSRISRRATASRIRSRRRSGSTASQEGSSEGRSRTERIGGSAHSRAGSSDSRRLLTRS